MAKGCFQGGGGKLSMALTTAAPGDVLVGKKFFAGEDDSLKTGAMPDNGAVTSTITTDGEAYTIPAGYHNGLGAIGTSAAGLLKYATGTKSLTMSDGVSGMLTVAGLPFQPMFILVQNSNNHRSLSFGCCNTDATAVKAGYMVDADNSFKGAEWYDASTTGYWPFAVTSNGFLLAVYSPYPDSANSHTVTWTYHVLGV